MKILIFPLLLFGLCLHLIGQGSRPHKKEKYEEIELTELTKGVWLHTAFMDLPTAPRFPANGVVAVSEDEAVIIDLPPNEKDTLSLFGWIESKGWKIRYIVPQHWHYDSTGGLSVAINQKLSVAMLDKTLQIMEKKQPLAPEIVFEKKVQLKFGTETIELAHYGGGHTIDSVVAWLPEPKVLAGGCLLKSTSSKNLGNIADADMHGYLNTLHAIKAAYPNATFVTPGHGKPGGMDVIDHTIKLRENFKPDK